MIQITVHPEKKFSIELKKEEIYLNTILTKCEIISIKKNFFHIIKDSYSYTLEVCDIDSSIHTYTIKINNKSIILESKSQLDLLIEKLGMSNSSSIQTSTIKAPMPGLIIDIKISENTSVKKGDTLLILEAMKMENGIKSPIDGIVKNIKVKKGENVEKNQLLIEF